MYTVSHTLDCYLRMRDDAIHFEKLLIRVSLRDVKLAHHGCPVALASAATEVRTIRESESEREKNTYNKKN